LASASLIAFWQPLVCSAFVNAAVFSEVFLIFVKVLLFFIRFNRFLHGFNCFNWFKLLFEPIRLELDRVSAQMVDSRPESWHFGKLAHGLLGWGTTLRELKVPSGMAPLKEYIYIFFFKTPNCSRVNEVGQNLDEYGIIDRWMTYN